MALLAAAVAALASPAYAESGWHLLNMTQGVTAISREIYSLHMLIFWVCVWIGVVGLRRDDLVDHQVPEVAGRRADTTMVHNTKVEVVWTAIPVIILIAMAVPAAKTLVQLEDTRNTELTIKVTGFQWGWQYEYLDNGVRFFSRLDARSDCARTWARVDPNTIEHYLLTWTTRSSCPSAPRCACCHRRGRHPRVVGAGFGMKKDAIPGYVNEMWFNVDAEKTGVYRGQCVELCGRDHGFMPIVVDVQLEEDFRTWLDDHCRNSRSRPPPAQPTAVANAG
jgi:cytochrome c oxidase subunit 2